MRLVALTVAALTMVAGAARAQDKAQIDRGMQVFTAQKCSVCHSIAGKGNKKGRWTPSARS